MRSLVAFGLVLIGLLTSTFPECVDATSFVHSSKSKISTTISTYSAQSGTHSEHADDCPNCGGHCNSPCHGSHNSHLGHGGVLESRSKVVFFDLDSIYGPTDTYAKTSAFVANLFRPPII